MSTNLCADVFGDRYAPVHDFGMDIPAVLRAITEKAGIKQEGLAEEIGVSQPQISRYMDGASPKKPAYDKIIAAARKYGIGTSEDVRSEDVAALLGTEPPPGVKVKGFLGAAGKGGYYADAQAHHEEIPSTASDPPNAIAFEIQGDSAGPWFGRWYVVFADVRNSVTAEMIGKPCIVWLDDGRVLLKEVRRNPSEPGRFDLYPNKEGALPDVTGVRVRQAAKILRITPR